jgi:hypothetical protein
VTRAFRDVQVDLLHGIATEELLLKGSDSRAQVTDGTMNRYGCRPYPRSATPFGSCTSSSPLPDVYEAAVKQHQRLQAAACAGKLDQEVRAGYARIVRGIKHQLELNRVAGVEVVLTPSGTDAEYLAVLLALGKRARPLHNIVVGPREVGSGTQWAAGARHFDSVTPHSSNHEPGTPVVKSVADLVTVSTVQLRTVDGSVRDSGEIDAEVEALCDQAVHNGERVLLHIVAHSKTGVHAPSLATARALCQRHGQHIEVLVDAAQGRVSRRGLLEALQSNFMVLFTGSKFYGGPPFSGALLVPERLAPTERAVDPIPAEFSAYFSAWEFPDTWSDFTAELEARYNLGLLLRWASAQRAIERYYAVAGDARFSILRRFEDFVPRAIQSAKLLELDFVEPARFPDQAERLLESKTTVFPFRVRRQHGPNSFFRKAELRQIAFLLNRDISPLAPGASEAELQMLRPSFHIGQPVFEGTETQPAVLRLALGAALLVMVGGDKHLGHTLPERLEWLDRQVQGVIVKLEWIAEHFDALQDARTT